MVGGWIVLTFPLPKGKACAAQSQGHKLNPAEKLQPLQLGTFFQLPEWSPTAGRDPKLLCFGQLAVPNEDIGEVKFF